MKKKATRFSDTHKLREFFNSKSVHYKKCEKGVLWAKGKLYHRDLCKGIKNTKRLSMRLHMYEFFVLFKTFKKIID